MNGNTNAARGLAVTLMAALIASGAMVALTTQLAQAASQATSATAQPSPSPGNGKWTLKTSVINHPRGIVPRVTRAQKPTAPSTPTQVRGANPNCPGCTPPLLFTLNTPVIGGITGTPGIVTITPVYWAPSGFVYTTNYKSIVNGYIANVALASRQNTNVFSVGTQYYQQANSSSPQQHIQYVVHAGAEVDDTAAFPAQGGSNCIADPGFTDCVADVPVQTELSARLTALALPIDDSHLYMVFFPQGVETCFGAGPASPTNACSTNVYCAYHSATSTSPPLVYGNEPFPPLNGCSDIFNGSPAPNGDAEADAQISLVSHEANETITDWAGAWFDSSGNENGDECAYTYGTPLGSTGGAGTFYNQAIGSGKYYTQDEFSNEDFALGLGDPVSVSDSTLVAGCVQKDELPTASFTFPASVLVGANAAFNGSASSDPDNSAALTYSWNWGDGTANGSGATPSHVFSSGGTDTVTLTVTDVDGWSGLVSHLVNVTVPPYVLGAVGTDNGLWVLHSGSPSFTSDGGVLLGAPAVVAVPQTTGPAVPLYIATGSDHGLYVRNDTQPWHVFGGGKTYCIDNPAGAIIAGTLYVACEGKDQALYHVETPAPSGTNLPTLNPNNWQRLGGILVSGPAVGSVAGTPTYLVIGTDQHVYSRDLVGSSFTRLSWVCIGHPALATFGSTSTFACHGTDNGLWYATNTGGGWSGAQSLGGSIADGVGIAATSTGPIFFVEAAGGGVYHRSISTGWMVDGGQVKFGVGACAL